LTKSKYSLVVQLSGVVSPNYKYNLPEDQQEHYATAAKFFTECCLLNRDVDVVLEGMYIALIMTLSLEPLAHFFVTASQI
jgi:hypothetical protein